MARLMIYSPRVLVVCLFLMLPLAVAETFPPLKDGKAPQNLDEMWGNFDPRAEPLETETLERWEEDGVELRIVRFRIGIFKGKEAKLAAVYGIPKKRAGRIPGLVQIHGGGQYADYRACLRNAQRGYATISIAWAGRISAPHYRVDPRGVQLFWDGKTDDPAYRITTDWGAVDGYHAPSRNPGNVFPSVKSAAWTLDSVESPRNSGWFLCAVAARRALTFLEKQSEVDPARLGVYGHSMGGKLAVLTSVDQRVKAAAPSCGGVSDRYNRSELFRRTLGDNASLPRISCPIIFLSPANDFHGRIGNLPATINEIKSREWRVTCSPHHNHQDTAEFEVATLLWFDQHLKKRFQFPKTPETTLDFDAKDRVPAIRISVDSTQKPQAVDVFYTCQGKPNETPADMQNSMHRYWFHARPVRQEDGTYVARLPLNTTERPLWVYANVKYGLDEAVTGAGYYYGDYTAKAFNVSSLITMVSPTQLKSAKVKANLKPTSVIESFDGDWRKGWFTYRPKEWAITTHKVYSPIWKAPSGARLSVEVFSEQPNQLVVRFDDFAAQREVAGKKWQSLTFEASDFIDNGGMSLADFAAVKRLKLSALERLRPKRGSKQPPRVFGKRWQGPPPEFRNLRWVTGN